MSTSGPGVGDEIRRTKLMSHKPLFHLGPDTMRVELDKKSLFALASDTRLEILKALQPMRRTVSQLSEALNIDKAAIHRHLKKMEEGGLVKRFEDHGFVYYGLSWKARDLMSPNENTKIVILISSMFVFSILAALLLVIGLGATDMIPSLAPARGEYDSGSNEIAFFRMAEDVPAIWVLPMTAFAVAAVTLSVMALRSFRRPRQRISPEAEASTVDRPVPDD